MAHLLKGIHIFDDDKFIDTAIELFEKFSPKSYKYYVIVPDLKCKFQYVTSSLVEPILLKTASEREEFVNEIIRQRYKVVYLHALNKRKRELIKILPEHVVAVWFIWGYDLYNAWPVLQEKIYSRLTQSFLNKDKEWRNILKNRFKKSLWSYKLFLWFHKKNNPRFSPIYEKLAPTHKDYYEAVQRVDVVVPVVKAEMKILRRMDIPAVYAPFSYVYLESLVKIDQPEHRGLNILVGNSGAPSNNHLEIFQMLSRINLNGRKIYVPMSYGGSDAYRDLIIKKGYELLGENFIPMVQFLTLDAYTQIISSCGTILFNQIRQQGVGNIVAMAYLGAQIFLNKKSPVYNEMREMGVQVFSIEDFSLKKLQVGLNEEQRKKNKRLMEETYSLKSVLKKIDDQNKLVLKKVAEKSRA